jgi:hypothetical protein
MMQDAGLRYPLFGIRYSSFAIRYLATWNPEPAIPQRHKWRVGRSALEPASIQ